MCSKAIDEGTGNPSAGASGVCLSSNKRIDRQSFVFDLSLLVRRSAYAHLSPSYCIFHLGNKPAARTCDQITGLTPLDGTTIASKLYRTDAFSREVLILCIRRPEVARNCGVLQLLSRLERRGVPHRGVIVFGLVRSSTDKNPAAGSSNRRKGADHGTQCHPSADRGPPRRR